jgi:hypothetical protein
MADWTTLANAITDLRRFLHDGPQDRLVKQKIVVGAVDGVNTQFFTFEDRIIAPSLIVTVDFTPVTVTVDDPITGEFHTDSPPARDTTVRAQYFFQYFLDSELEEALNFAMIQVLQVEDVTTCPVEMKYAVMHYAGHFAYQKQAMRWAERMSHKFLLEEEPLQAEVLARSNMFNSIATKLLDNGERLRDDIYKRAGRRNAPAFGVYKPQIPPVGPRR